MKYLHIIPPSKRMMDTYIRMIRTYFKEGKEELCLLLNGLYLLLFQNNNVYHRINLIYTDYS